jgi:hypothetical protein
MVPQLRKSSSILLALLPVLILLAASVRAAPTASSRVQAAPETMPDGLMSAILAASAQPFEAGSYLERKVTAPDGAASDEFGYSVSLSGDTALVGVPWDDVGGGEMPPRWRRSGGLRR